jgi:hypothetical protein
MTWLSREVSHVDNRIYRFPVRDGAEEAVAVFREQVELHPTPHLVTLCTFDLIATTVTIEVLDELLPRPQPSVEDPGRRGSAGGRWGG